MNVVSGHDSAMQGYTGSRTTLYNEMDIVSNRLDSSTTTVPHLSPRIEYEDNVSFGISYMIQLINKIILVGV